MIVFDSYALMAYLEREPGYETARDVLTKAAESGQPCLMTYVNWGEIYYLVYREQGPARAEEIAQLIATFPIEIVEIDYELARQAAIFKATRKMSYADCFAAALAKLKKAVLITGDKEFKQLEGEIRISWL
jgi:predicted nucleic acid-binding protein